MLPFELRREKKKMIKNYFNGLIVVFSYFAQKQISVVFFQLYRNIKKIKSEIIKFIKEICEKKYADISNRCN